MFGPRTAPPRAQRSWNCVRRLQSGLRRGLCRRGAWNPWRSRFHLVEYTLDHLEVVERLAFVVGEAVTVEVGLDKETRTDLEVGLVWGIPGGTLERTTATISAGDSMGQALLVPSMAGDYSVDVLALRFTDGIRPAPPETVDAVDFTVVDTAGPFVFSQFTATDIRVSAPDPNDPENEEVDLEVLVEGQQVGGRHPYWVFSLDRGTGAATTRAETIKVRPGITVAGAVIFDEPEVDVEIPAHFVTAGHNFVFTVRDDDLPQPRQDVGFYIDISRDGGTTYSRFRPTFTVPLARNDYQLRLIKLGRECEFDAERHVERCWQRAALELNAPAPVDLAFPNPVQNIEPADLSIPAGGRRTVPFRALRSSLSFEGARFAQARNRDQRTVPVVGDLSGLAVEERTLDILALLRDRPRLLEPGVERRVGLGLTEAAFDLEGASSGSGVDVPVAFSLFTAENQLVSLAQLPREDLPLSLPSSLTLNTVSAPERSVVLLLDPDGASPRWELFLGSRPPGAPPQRGALEITIPRYGYRFESLEAMESGSDIVLTVRLNAPAPTTLQVTVVADDGQATPQELMLRIFRGSPFNLAVFRGLTADRHYVFSIRETTIPGDAMPGDQTVIEAAPALAQQSLGSTPPEFQVQAGLDRELLVEGESARLNLEATGLDMGSLLLFLSPTPDQGVSLSLEDGQSAERVVLSSQAPTATVIVRALDDELPEARTLLHIGIAATGAMVSGSTRVRVQVARNDWLVQSITAPDRVLPDREFETSMQLNGMAPAPVDVRVQARDRETGSVIGVGTMVLSQGDTAAVMLSLPDLPELPGGGRFVLVPDAEFTEYRERDQRILPLKGDSSDWPRVEVVPIVLSLSPSTATLREGESMDWTLAALSGLDLLEGASLNILLQEQKEDPADPDQLLMTPATVSLSESAPAATVQVQALDDGRAEVRQSLQFTAVDSASQPVARSAAAHLTIPRNGYRVQSFTVEPAEPDISLGEMVRVQVMLNAPPRSEVLLEFEVEPPGLSLPAALMRIPPPETPGASGPQGVDVLFSPQAEAGTYIITLSTASFVTSEMDDQQMIPGAPISRTLTVTFQPFALATSIEPAAGREGELLDLELVLPGDMNLPADLVFDVAVSAPTHASELLFYLSGDTAAAATRTLNLGLGADARTATVRVLLVDDALPEAREAVQIRVDGELIISTEVRAVIARDDYLLQALRVVGTAADCVASPTPGVSSLVEGERFHVCVVFNAPLPAPARVIVQVPLPEDPGVGRNASMPHELLVPPGSTTGLSVGMVAQSNLERHADYVLEVTSAVFTVSAADGLDQRDIGFAPLDVVAALNVEQPLLRVLLQGYRAGPLLDGGGGALA